MGEAAKRLDPAFKAKYFHVKWKEMAGTRDILIHEYFGVDYDIIWNLAENILPELLPIIEQIIELEERQG
ncbi:MAG TPA: HepT-like ribonuclease domain-containing protein [Chitinophagales bacterium]|nr:HepT-like ribonuclease domain-containing protein [Chitinophagales bacterium]